MDAHSQSVIRVSSRPFVSILALVGSGQVVLVRRHAAMFEELPRDAVGSRESPREAAHRILRDQIGHEVPDSGLIEARSHQMSAESTLMCHNFVAIDCRSYDIAARRADLRCELKSLKELYWLAVQAQLTDVASAFLLLHKIGHLDQLPASSSSGRMKVWTEQERKGA